MTKPSVPSFSNPLQFDHLMLEPVHEMMHTGIRIDQEEKERLQTVALEQWDKDQAQLDIIVGRPLNVSSTKWVPYYLFTILGLPKKTRKTKLRSDEEALRSLMAECMHKVYTVQSESAQYRWKRGYLSCHFILKVRGQRKKISSYLGLHIEKGVLKGPAPFEDPDGRLRGTISVGGTETARFSHSKTLWGTGVNLATIPLELRTMYIADDGYELCEFDMQRGESWIYAHLSEDPELLRIHTGGLDFHAETAAVISSAVGDPISADWVVANKDGKAYKIRFTSKKINHATSYRMGAKTGADSVNAEAEETGVTITIAQFKKAQALWHEKYFMIRSTWWPEIERTLGTSRTMKTPYGRIHQFHDAWGEGLFKTATAYVPQSTSVDYINRGYLRVYHLFEKLGAWDLKVLAQTHDSVLVQYKQEHRDEVIPSVVEELTSELTIKHRTFTIPIEANYGQSWGDLTKYSA